MIEEGKIEDSNLEEGPLETSSTTSMASQRRHPAIKPESEDTNGFVEGGGPLIPTVHPTPRRKPDLITYDELPTWYQDNEHIIGGYRPESFSTYACFASLTYMHNETVNIYTHMIPAIVFLFAQVFILYLLHQQFPEANPVDYVVFSFFLLAACITLSLSFLYHTLMNHSMGISYLWLRLDYVGILALILGCFVSGIRVGFYCDPTLQKIYWSMVRIS
jgi:adiponectin receptor